MIAAACRPTGLANRRRRRRRGGGGGRGACPCGGPSPCPWHVRGPCLDGGPRDRRRRRSPLDRRHHPRPRVRGRRLRRWWRGSAGGGGTGPRRRGRFLPRLGLRFRFFRVRRPLLRLRLRLGGAARDRALRRSVRGLDRKLLAAAGRSPGPARHDQARPEDRPSSSRSAAEQPYERPSVVRPVGRRAAGVKGMPTSLTIGGSAGDGLRLDDRLARLRPRWPSRSARRPPRRRSLRPRRLRPSPPSSGLDRRQCAERGRRPRSASRPSASRSAHSELSYTPRLPITTTWKRRTSNSFPQYRQHATLTESPDVTGPSPRVAGRP